LLEKYGFLGIFLFASIPNPLFDLAGITCGHFQVPFWTFFGATLLGKSCVKATIQSIVVVTAFSKETIDTLLAYLKVCSIWLHDLAQNILVRQASLIGDESPGSEPQSTSLIGLTWNGMVTMMLIYFGITMLESFASSYYTDISNNDNKADRALKGEADSRESLLLPELYLADGSSGFGLPPPPPVPSSTIRTPSSANSVAAADSQPRQSKTVGRGSSSIHRRATLGNLHFQPQNLLADMPATPSIITSPFGGAPSSAARPSLITPPSPQYNANGAGSDPSRFATIRSPSNTSAVPVASTSHKGNSRRTMTGYDIRLPPPLAAAATTAAATNGNGAATPARPSSKPSPAQPTVPGVEGGTAKAMTTGMAAVNRGRELLKAMRESPRLGGRGGPSGNPAVSQTPRVPRNTQAHTPSGNIKSEAVEVGTRVFIETMHLKGTVRYIGPIDGKSGTWAGVELDDVGNGKNDGTVAGKKYFECPPNTGIFIAPSKLSPERQALPGDDIGGDAGAAPIAEAAATPSAEGGSRSIGSVLAANPPATPVTKTQQFGPRANRIIAMSTNLRRATALHTAKGATPRITGGTRAGAPTPARTTPAPASTAIAATPSMPRIRSPGISTPSSRSSSAAGRGTLAGSSMVTTASKITRAKTPASNDASASVQRTASREGSVRSSGSGTRSPTTRLGTRTPTSTRSLSKQSVTSDNSNLHPTAAKPQQQQPPQNGRATPISGPADSGISAGRRASIVARRRMTRGSFSSAVESSEDVVSRLQSQIETMSAEINLLRMENNDAKAKLAASNIIAGDLALADHKGIDAVAEVEAALNREREDRKRDQQGNEVIISELRHQVEELKAKLEQQQREKAASQEEQQKLADALNSSLEARSAELETLRKQQEQVREAGHRNSQSLTDECQRLTQELDAKDFALTAVNTKLDEVIAEYEAAKTKYEQDIEDLKKEAALKSELAAGQSQQSEEQQNGGEEVPEVIIASLGAVTDILAGLACAVLNCDDATKPVFNELDDAKVRLSAPNAGTEGVQEWTALVMQSLESVQVGSARQRERLEESKQRALELEQQLVQEAEARRAVSEQLEAAMSSSRMEKVDESKVEQLKAVIQQLKSRIEELEVKTGELEAMNSELVHERAVFIKDQKDVNDYLAKLEAECNRLVDDIEILNAENERLSEELATTSLRASMAGGLESQSVDSRAEAAGGDVNKEWKNNETSEGVQKEQSSSAAESNDDEWMKRLESMRASHRMEIQTLRKQLAELEVRKNSEIEQLNNDLNELEGMIEDKVFKEAELEEEVSQLRKMLQKYQATVTAASGGSDTALQHLGDEKGHHGESLESPLAVGLKAATAAVTTTITTTASSRTDGEKAEDEAPAEGDDQVCDICDQPGHSIVNCPSLSAPSAIFKGNSSVDASRPYCDNCEEFDLHWTEDCPNLDETF
ncbi:hypothetical protein EV182_001225, partial [Spiromyces aspiralis]